MGSLGRRIALGLVLALPAAPSALLAGGSIQTDWSGGAAGASAVTGWERDFASSEGVSWLAVPGQLTLSGVVLGQPVEHIVDDGFGRPASLDAADIDGDGDLDLVGAGFGGNQVRWWRNEGGRPPIWTSQLIEGGFAAASSVRVADVDGDGELDVIGCAWTDREVVVWFNNGQGVDWTRQSVATGFDQCHWVDAADLDNDGDVDLLGAAAAADTVAVWFNDGGSPVGWTMQVIDGNYAGARSLVPTDLDADGDVDLLGTALDDDDLSWWRNDGGEPVSWTRQIVTASLAGSHHADTWDLDLDGDLDIVGVGFGYPWVKVWRNDGGDPAGWIGEDIGAPIVAPLVVAVGDLDGDGDLDVVATSNNWNRVMWWRNDGGPVAGWERFDVVRDFTNAWPVAVADLDGNGALDVVSGASGGLVVAWWELTDFVDRGVLESRVVRIPDHVTGLECELDAVTPTGTAVSVAVRFGTAADALGDWLPIEPGQRLPMLARGPVFLQYRLELESSIPDTAPIVRSIAMDWESGLPARVPSGGRVRP